MINDSELERIKRATRERLEQVAQQKLGQGAYQQGEITTVPSLDVLGDLVVRGTIRSMKGEYNQGRSLTSDLGVNHEGMNETELWHAESNLADATQYYASLGMGLDDDSYPALMQQAWKLGYPYTNLLLNGNFGSGDFTNWTKTTETNGAWAILPGGYGDGNDHAVFVVPGDEISSSGDLQSDNITINAGSYYLIQGYVKLSGSVAFLNVLFYYTISGVTNYEYVFRGREGAYIQDYARFSRVVYIPGSVATTGTAYVKLSAATDAAGAAEFHFDELSVRYCEAASSQNLSAGYQYPRQFKAFFNQFTTPTITETLSTSQPYGVYFITDDAVDADTDTYTLDQLWDAGTWTVDILHLKFASAGKFDAYLDNTKLNSTPVDWYAGSTTYQQHWIISSFTISTPGRHTFQIVVNGTNPSSGKYRMGGTCITARRTGP